MAVLTHQNFGECASTARSTFPMSVRKTIFMFGSASGYRTLWPLLFVSKEISLAR